MVTLHYYSKYYLHPLAFNKKYLMKINFDDIFQSPSHRLKRSQASKFSNFETNPTLANSIAIEKKDTKVIHTKLYEAKPDVMNIIQRHKKE